MLRALVALVAVTAATAQYVSPYAQGWSNYPSVLPQYGGGATGLLDDRQGPHSDNPSFNLETRVSQFPVDRQPYWYVNKDVLHSFKQQEVPVFVSPVFGLLRPVSSTGRSTN